METITSLHLTNLAGPIEALSWCDGHDSMQWLAGRPGCHPVSGKHARTVGGVTPRSQSTSPASANFAHILEKEAFFLNRAAWHQNCIGPPDAAPTCVFPEGTVCDVQPLRG